MTTPDHTIPPIPALALLGAVVASCVAACGLVIVSNQSLPPEAASTVMRSTLMGGTCVLLSGISAIVILRSATTTPGVNIGGAMLAFSGARLLGSLLAAVVCVVLFEPDRQSFGYAFILAALAALILETLILRRWSATVGAAPSTPANPAASHSGTSSLSHTGADAR
jgi:hypothetical protein